MSAAAKPKKTPAKKSTDKPLKNLIVEAIKNNKDKRNGCSRAAIKNYVLANSKDRHEGGQLNAAIRRSIDAGVKAGSLAVGATPQRFKMGKEAAKPKKATKKSAKKAKKPAKKTAKKNTKKATKKTTPKKTAKKVVKKKTPAKKSAKKTASKKSAKKTAPKKA